MKKEAGRDARCIGLTSLSVDIGPVYEYPPN